MDTSTRITNRARTFFRKPIHLPPEDDELIEEIRRKWTKGRKRGKFSTVIHEALKLLAEKEGISG
ncbi:hypothetical protein BCF55_1102 [Hydrogenivirga caldilitoris]|uniref:Uncharacterized protein n=1 Tax=Hydrogenivirga caldilitoris TaxID=246264 RepID=A0A497XRV0_9AQUI|nr:hypothetical protein [Hydrogenivirga caldilitoris]RLJ70819.1 hypothetical protein BCF55_1102 [Hydrogenivirga caldilitoris]